jgi:putative PEP-CTERM system histidine kinase
MRPQGILFLMVLVSSLLPVGAVLLRRRSRILRIAAVLTAASTVGYFLLLHLATGLEVPDLRSPWIYGLAACAVPLLLSGYLLSVGIGREHPEDSFKVLRRTFALLGFVGLVALAFLRSPSFLTGIDQGPGGIRISVGSLGRAYLCFLLIGIVFIGYNLESTYRVASPTLRSHLRAPFLGLFSVLGFLTYVLTSGTLYARVDLAKLLASAIPFSLANVLVAYGLLRGSLEDKGAPVSRHIVYSSFTALAAGLYVFAIGFVAQISSFTKWSPDQVVTLSFGFLAILIAVLLLVSNRFQRRVRRFIDRNFYVNRYDYRTQWARVTETMDRARGRNEVLSGAVSLLTEVFLADGLTIALKDRASGALRPVLGKGLGDPEAVLPEDAPLAGTLLAEKHALLLERRTDDLEYMAIYAENGDWLDRTASRVVAPILDGSRLVGLVGLERNHDDDPFTFEDVALLDSMVGHVASALRGVELSEELAESREMEVMSQWSNLILHDLKNYLSPLRMSAQNLITLRDRPGIRETVAQDITRVTDRMEALVRTLSELRDDREVTRGTVDVNELVRDTVEDLQLSRRDGLDLVVMLGARQGVQGDRGMLQRVLVNLLTNALEAMRGRGTLTVKTEDRGGGSEGRPLVVVSVIDTGEGMSEEFLRERLFRPFATTKAKGLGLGLYQCRAIVRAHGGTLKAESRRGSGTTFRLSLLGAQIDEVREELQPAVTAGRETA